MADEIPPPFNMVKATFYLVASVFITYAIAAVVGEVGCMFAKFRGLELAVNCGENIIQVFNALLAAALAYAAGHSTGASK